MGIYGSKGSKDAVKLLKIKGRGRANLGRVILRGQAQSQVNGQGETYQIPLIANRKDTIMSKGETRRHLTLMILVTILVLKVLVALLK